MTLDELRTLCVEAAKDLAERGSRPLPATVLLPLPDRTQVIALPDFPDDDRERFDLLSRFAAERMVPNGAPCFGFIAEATLTMDGEPVDVLMVTYGARGRGAFVTAAPLSDGNLGAFEPPEELDPAAMPFLRPLQHAADLAEPPAGPLGDIGLG